jgi:hypothetical protein
MRIVADRYWVSPGNQSGPEPQRPRAASTARGPEVGFLEMWGGGSVRIPRRRKIAD